MTFKKTFALVAALALATASLPAQAGPLGNAFAAGAIGFAAEPVASGLITNAVVSESTYADECSYRPRPVVDAYGNQVGWQRVTVC